MHEQFKNQTGENSVPLLWRHFDYIELRTIVRQQDPVFCDLLNNVRLGKLTECNINLLKDKNITTKKKKKGEEKGMSRRNGFGFCFAS